MVVARLLALRANTAALRRLSRWDTPPLFLCARQSHKNADAYGASHSIGHRAYRATGTIAREQNTNTNYNSRSE